MLHIYIYSVSVFILLFTSNKETQNSGIYLFCFTLLYLSTRFFWIRFLICVLVNWCRLILDFAGKFQIGYIITPLDPKIIVNVVHHGTLRYLLTYEWYTK